MVIKEGRYMQLMNHGILPLKLIMQYVLIKLNLNNCFKKKRYTATDVKNTPPIQC